MNGRTVARPVRGRIVVGVTLALALATSACRDMGLRGNVPLAEAETRAFRYSVYAAGEPGVGEIEVAGRTWIGQGVAQELPAQLLTPVPEVAQVHALAWDRPPYDRLYLRQEDGNWLPLAPVR